MEWQKSVLKAYEEEPFKVKAYWFGWVTLYEYAHYTTDYFKEILFNMHELIRSCESKDTLFFSVDY